MQAAGNDRSLRLLSVYRGQHALSQYDDYQDIGYTERVYINFQSRCRYARLSLAIIDY